MSISVSNLSGSNAAKLNPEALATLKDELVAVLKAAGISDASATDKTPKGFPDGVSWQEAYKMVAIIEDDNNPSTLGTFTLSNEKLQDKLKEKLLKNIGATKKLQELGYTDFSIFKKKGLSAAAALDSLFQSNAKGILISALASVGVYDLSAFPQGTTAFQAFKLIEDPVKPGVASKTKFTELKDAFSALSSLGIKTLTNFPRGTSALEAKNILEPKAVLMLKMVGMSTNDFKKRDDRSSISALDGLAILNKLPDSIRELKAEANGKVNLPAKIQALISDTAAAKKLVIMGYESLDAFKGMKSLSGKPSFTASDALAETKKSPIPADLPLPPPKKADEKDRNYERMFQSQNDSKIKSYGAHNEIRNTLYVATTADKVKPNPAPGTTIITAAEVLAANAIYWSKK